MAKMADLPKSSLHFTEGRLGPIDFLALLPPSLIRLLGQQEILAKDESGRRMTHLSAAAGDCALLKVLLQQGLFSPKDVCDNGMTALAYTAEHRQKDAVQLLLERPGSDVEARYNHGQTPLSRAACHGHEQVIRLLLSHPRAKAHSGDKCGRTPLSCCSEWALQCGSVTTRSTRGQSRRKRRATDYVRLLRLRGRLAGSGAVEQRLRVRSRRQTTEASGHSRLLRQRLCLLDRADVEADSRDINGSSPLWYAALGGHAQIAALLLARPDVEAGAKGERGSTPLSCAAWRGHQDVVRFLLARSDVKVDSRNRYNRTPLSYARESGSTRRGSGRRDCLTC
jgi:ankyrin repeat protein